LLDEASQRSYRGIPDDPSATGYLKDTPEGDYVTRHDSTGDVDDLLAGIAYSINQSVAGVAKLAGIEVERMEEPKSDYGKAGALLGDAVQMMALPGGTIGKLALSAAAFGLTRPEGNHLGNAGEDSLAAVGGRVAGQVASRGADLLAHGVTEAIPAMTKRIPVIGPVVGPLVQAALMAHPKVAKAVKGTDLAIRGAAKAPLGRIGAAVAPPTMDRLSESPRAAVVVENPQRQPPRRKPWPAPWTNPRR
jgi:hypothetical protein